MKNLVLDTSVLIYDPSCLKNFDDNIKHIPISVVEELDGLKKASGEVGVNARQCSRIIDEAIQNGFRCGKGTINIVVDNVSFKFKGLKPCNDNYILGVAQRLSSESDFETILITKDINLRIKAESFGIKADDYHRDYVDECIVGNIIKKTVDSDVINDIYKRKVRGADADCIEDHIAKENQCFILRDANCGKSALARYQDGRLIAIKEHPDTYGIKARNAEQKFALDMLKDEMLDCVILSGSGGAGKTILAMAAGMEWVDKGLADRMTIAKVIKPIGETIGLLPGSKEEKLTGWLGPYFDNLEFLLRKNKVVKVQNLIDSGKIELESLEYIRGRSLMNRWIVVDEMQNCEPAYLKTIVSRIGEGSKLILLGDPDQIDHPMLSKKNNGLVYAMNRLQDTMNVGMLQLHTSVRSKLAQIAVDRL